MTNTDRTPAIALYGATGHTGGYILAELRRRGLTPILVGRNAERLRAAADAAGLPEAEIRIADLDDHAALVAAFTGADVVISSLVAFVDLGGAVLAAAIDAGAHYTDTSGEQQFLRRVLDEYGPRAEKAGVTVISGVTDNNLAADLLADLTVPRLAGPVELVVTHRSRSGGNGSKGSAKTVLANLDWFRNGGWHYETGELRTGAAARHRELTFPGDATPTAVTKSPQSAVLTIPRHTDVTYVAGAIELAYHANLSGFTSDALDLIPDAPDSDLRYDVIVDAFGPAGARAQAVVSGGDSYRDSALLTVEVATRLAAGGTRAGALAPAEAFDAAEFLDALAPHGITWSIALQ
ncbi:saccharopine dehydrogenase NADP-binding domain-containing protein [Nocardia tengchongensis]